MGIKVHCQADNEEDGRRAHGNAIRPGTTDDKNAGKAQQPDQPKWPVGEQSDIRIHEPDEEILQVGSRIRSTRQNLGRWSTMPPQVVQGVQCHQSAGKDATCPVAEDERTGPNPTESQRKGNQRDQSETWILSGHQR